MIFSLDVRPARKGDCLLLHFGSKSETGLILVDGGPKNVYQQYLKPRIKEIKAGRHLAPQEPLLVNLLMVSHIDDDHIQGILDLTREEIMAKHARQPRMLKVLSFWHNSFEEIIEHDSGILADSMRKQFGEAALSGDRQLSHADRLMVEEGCSEHPEVVASSLSVLASIEQGFRLRKDVESLGFPLNPEFSGQLVMADSSREAVEIAPGLRLTIVGPMAAELTALRKKHIEWLKSLKEKDKPLPAALAAYIDRAIPNLSSIVVLAEMDSKRILLTGDARGDKILAGLQQAGLLAAGSDSKIYMDVLKVPHHGSVNNLNHDFFERIIADHYVFSGNGEHGNPEREALEMLLAARGDAKYTMHFTYPVKEIDIERKKDWCEQQQREQNSKKKNPKQRVRADWSHEKQSLTVFFAEREDIAKKVSVVKTGQPHVINVFDELGY